MNSLETTVGEFAKYLKKDPSIFLEKLSLAGIKKSSLDEKLTEADKLAYLGYLQKGHADGNDRRKKITLIKKSTEKNKQTDASRAERVIQVEVRKKRTFIQRSDDDSKPEKLRVDRIQAKAFKAFRDFDFQLQGRHLLAYGGNGAGKSSLYWLLYTFLQSGQKSTDEVSKYFDSGNPVNLLNVHSSEAARTQANISVSLRSHRNDLIEYPISALQHQTKDRPEIAKANLASDFVTYRTLFNFYRFRNSETIDLWTVFETEILPFINTTNPAEPNLGNAWLNIKKEHELVVSSKTAAKAKRATALNENIERFNQYLAEALESISKEAQKFYSDNFGNEDAEKLVLVVVLSQPASHFDFDTNQFDAPKIGFGVKLGNTELKRPHTFLNEAKLTQLALSVRFGSTLANLQESSLKLLVLDDLLISLDMNNRMKVVDIILGDTFADFQKIILTHDIGFFEEFRRRIGGLQSDWSFQRFSKPNAETGINLIEDRSAIEKAEDYLNGQNLDEAASSIRKAAEATAARFRTGTVVATEDFVALTKQLNSAKKKLLEKIPFQLYEQVLKDLPQSIKQHLVPTTDIGLSVVPGITAAQIEEIVKLRLKLNTVVSSSHWQMIENAKIVDEVLATTARVLNPGSHGGATPLYETEVRHALELVKKLERCLI